MSNIHQNSIIAKNTIFLYFRMFITMGLYLYTSRIVLNILGVDDFGIYNVVGGIVILLSFLNSSMASATQKFLLFEIGKFDFVKLKQVFSMSLNIHILIAIVIFIIAETLGLWFLNYKLVIPQDRMVAANWVYQFSILSFMVTVIWVPYNALIIAHEKMKVYAIVSIIDVSLKLFSVFLLFWLGDDKLITYSIMLFIVSFLVFLVYKIYCKKKFKESSYIFFWDKTLFEIMLKFAGWNLFGNLAGITMVQGVNILLNLFFGPAINTARGIAFQLNGAVNSFVSNFQTALNPQIHKSFANSDLKYMHSLIYGGSKYSFFLLYLFVLPILFKMEYVLELWLNIVPPYSVIFCQLLLIISLIDSISGTLMTSVQATGKIKFYQVIVSGIVLFNMPLSYLFLKLGYSPESTLCITLLLSLLSFVARLIIVSELINLNIHIYVKKVIFKIIVVFVPTFLISYLINQFSSNDFSGLLILTICHVIVVLGIVYLIGVNKVERDIIISKLVNLFSRINYF